MSLCLRPRVGFSLLSAVGCRMKARAPGRLRLGVCWDSMYDAEACMRARRYIARGFNATLS
jgi:hypothetical protein